MAGSDMKAGPGINCFVLAAFAKFGGSPAPLLGCSPATKRSAAPKAGAVIEAEARKAGVSVFNSEPGRVSGNVVTGRKGGVFMVCRITGRQRIGRQFHQGISAIGELARKVQALHAITDLDRGITLNVGLVSGGHSVNTVAPWAEGQIDLRYVSVPDRDDAMARISAIIERSACCGTKAELTVRGEFCH